LDVVRHPLEFQFGFERIFDNLRWSDSRKRLKDKLKLSRRAKHVRGALSNEQLASEAFAALLRDILYARHDNRQDLRPTDTLSLIARAIRRSALAPGGQGMVRQVITFNVDDLLERVVNARHRRRLLAMPVTRASEIAHLANRKCVGVYHLHGFVPQNATRYPYRTWDGGVIEDVRLPVESLVFTDEQYWQTVGSPGGFASRIFAQALSGTCVFVGLSMTDINILRWLAQHATEVKREFRLMTAGWTNADEAEFDASEEISRHFWITEQRFDKHLSLKSDFGLGVLRSVLQNRGVDIIEIPSWTSKEFHEWWKAVFLS
jgi:hypothetical protein